MDRRNVIQKILASVGLLGVGAFAKPLMASASMPALSGAKEFDELVELQCREAAFDYDPYMTGLANGMIFARSALFGGDPAFMEAPKKMKSKSTHPFELLRDVVREDPDYAWAWHSRISETLADDGIEYARANSAAALLMDRLFRVDTTSRENCKPVGVYGKSVHGVEWVAGGESKTIAIR